jgi:hypothetical protein
MNEELSAKVGWCKSKPSVTERIFSRVYQAPANFPEGAAVVVVSSGVLVLETTSTFDALVQWFRRSGTVVST